MRVYGGGDKMQIKLNFGEKLEKLLNFSTFPPFLPQVILSPPPPQQKMRQNVKYISLEQIKFIYV